MKNKNLKIIGVIVALAVILVVTIVAFTQCGNKKPSSNTEKNTETMYNVEDFEDVTIQVETDADFVEPGKNTLEMDKISGFTQKKNNKNGNSNAKKDSEEDEDVTAAVEVEEVSIELSDPALTIESVGSYTGNYVEDGSDEPIKNVASIIITNHSDKMLQVGDITFRVNDKETVKFRVTNLLPGASALVLEADKKKYKAKHDYSYGEVVNAYLDKPDLMKKKFEIVGENGKLTLKNKTDDTYKKIYIYYKYVQSGGAYMGGITYRVPFENVEANKSVTSVANHFNANTSRIIDVQIAEQ